MNQIQTIKERFVDAEGRQVILHGMNMVCKNKADGYIGNWTEQDFLKLKQWGMNVIRLGMSWDALEPTPGHYDDAYIERTRAIIQLAEQHDIYVFLDMHQDLYSSLFSNGAPAWATLTDNHTYAKTEVWSDAYLFDGAVQTAFDHFWRNSPAPDGIGLQDHYISTWSYAVRQLHDAPNLIGYDLMNEPFIGTDVQNILGALFGAFAEVTAEQTGEPPMNMEQLLGLWMDPSQRHEALSLMNNVEVYRRLMEPTAIAQAPFERDVLTALYQKTRDAIREVDRERMIFLETNYFSNMGVESSIMPLVDSSGEKDSQQVYAPHGYDIVTDTPDTHLASQDRVSYIFEQHESTRKRLEMPMLVGEWGAYYGSQKSEHASLHIKRTFERLLCSDTYWSYMHTDMDKYSSFKGVQRGYPMATAGIIERYSYDETSGGFSMDWHEDGSISAPTLVYLPTFAANAACVTLTSPSMYEWFPFENTEAGILQIASAGGGKRRLRIG
ncbi:cellulase family glycosylhydrolase [Paenibacillus sp. strain BS8-2]